MPDWGIFTQDGQTVLAADTVLNVDQQGDYSVADYPQEEGGFFSYNKVRVPFTGRVTFGVATDRPTFLQALETAKASLDLYVLVTPDFSYPSVNVVHSSYRRERQRGGATMIMVEVGVEEIRVLATGEVTNSQSVNGASTQDGGTVQTSDTTPVNGDTTGGSGFALAPDHNKDLTPTTAQFPTTPFGAVTSPEGDQPRSASGAASSPAGPGTFQVLHDHAALDSVDGGGTSFIDNNAPAINQGVIAMPF